MCWYLRAKQEEPEPGAQAIDFTRLGVSAILGLNLQISYIILLAHNLRLYEWERRIHVLCELIFAWILLFCVQVCWLWKKVKSAGPQSFQTFLDTVQYTSTGILRYERIFGEGYVSTGGFGKLETVEMSWL